ncbi:trimethylamine N-oxide reductase system protein TorE [Vibrio breoganii]|uniref:trimethylamine N-oxide reductase system protein TorE n=1 Tax=Vibrio breoganii TaxID=553239 RepID=UPI0010BD5325|nr:trimethylamine N-oxide reductase system protein TorE [Vibrio breoganii]TKG24669.1 trimethylamine N-oxide reductase system protein TorE [Vibrio breoganii]
MSDMNNIQEEEKSSLEWKAFLVIAVVLFPVLSVVLVGGYGFVVWMLQVFVWGPPGIHG